MMNRLFSPWLLANKNKFFANTPDTVRTLAMVLLGTVICTVLYGVIYRVLHYFHAQNELGIMLSLKLFQMIWILLFAMLIFSCMVTAVSTFYLSEDNEIMLAAPISTEELLQYRYFTTTLSTSWMVIVFSLPVFMAYGTIFKTGPLYLALTVLCVFSIAFTGSALSVLVTIVLVYLFPAKRTKDIILYLSLCFGLFLYLIFRLIRPEELVNPDQYGQFIEYFSAISAPAGPWLPAGWAANMLSEYLLERHVDWLLLGLLILTPPVFYFAAETAMYKLFTPGFSKSQESFGGNRAFNKNSWQSGRFVWFIRKELRQFTRDSNEWSQLFMIAALVVVYLYNFKALPLDRSPLPTIYISNLIAFANIGLAGFLSASLATRFVYPSISSEKGAFYLIRSSPLSITRFFCYKYVFYLPPFTILTLILISVSNHLLQVSGPLQWISIYLALLITWTVLAMGLSFGALFADFKSENRMVALGPGPILFLLLSICYMIGLIGLGILPTYRLVRASIGGYELLTSELILVLLWLAGGAVVSFLICLFMTRLGVNSLEA